MRRFTCGAFQRFQVAHCGAGFLTLRCPPLLALRLRTFSTSIQLHAHPIPEAAAPAAAAPQTKAPTISTEHDVSIVDGNGQHIDVTPLDSFTDLRGAPEWLKEGLHKLKYPSTTDIQKFTIPLLSAGRDVIGLAPTGSGKTVAFAVPALEKFRRNANSSPSILVLAPTRELVQQTTKVFESLGGSNIRVCEAYGGTPREIQARRLHSGCDVLVACPGRLKDFLDNNDITIRNLSFLVFDEADRLLDMGFQIQLEEIMTYIDSASPPQTMMWSATWPESVQELARNYLSTERVLIRAGTAGTGLQVNEHIKQKIFFCNSFSERIEKLAELVEDGTIDDNNDKLIIFVERQSDTESVANAFSQRLGIDSRYVGALHGGLPQRQRDRVMSLFKKNDIRLLVATDVASRGLDIPDVTCVVNFQAPSSIDSYCHRIGRTGRAGRSGTAYTFMGSKDGNLAGNLVDYLMRCGDEVPAELERLTETHRHRTQSRSQRPRGGERGRSFGGQGGDYNRQRRDEGGSRRFRSRDGGFRGSDSNASATDW